MPHALSPPPIHLRRLKHKLLTLSLATLPIALPNALYAPLATAQTQQQPFEIPAGSLEQALNTLGRQSGIVLMFSSELVNGLSSSGLNALLTPGEALQQLLDGTGLIATPQSGGGYSIVAVQSATALPPVKVSGDAINTTTEGTGAYSTGAVSVTKGNQSLKNTPQAISVVSHLQIEEQNLFDINQALSETPGITVEQYYGEGTRIFSRGFRVTSFRTDGGSPTSQAGRSYTYLSDLTAYDHVEVLRGSDALFTGSGSPGGSVNLVRKRPTAEAQTKVGVRLGSWDNYRVEADYSNSLNSWLRGRIAVSYNDREYFYDRAESEKKVIYAVLEGDLGEKTVLTFGGSYEDSGSKPWQGGGIPRYLDGSRIDPSRSTSYVFDWNDRTSTTTEMFAKLEHQLNSNWTVNLNSSYRTQKTNALVGIAGFGTDWVDPDSGIATGILNFWNVAVEHEQYAIDGYITGSLYGFNRAHNITAGLDVQSLDLCWSGANSFGIGDVDIINVDPKDYPRPDVTRITSCNMSTNHFQDERKTGAYFSGRFELTDKMHVLLGGRLSNIEGNIDADKHELTPYYGFTYRFTDSTSAYGSVAEIFESQASYQGTDGSSLKPVTGTTYEIGVKSELYGGLVNASFSLYRLEHEGQALQIPGTISPCCYQADGLVESEGVDMEISGEILPDWNLTAGYTYNRLVYKNGVTDFSSEPPKHMLKLWSSYRLAGDWQQWKVGGGIKSQSEFKSDGYDLYGYTLLDGFVEYNLNKQIALSLNLNNLLDETYYHTNGWYGEPRNVTLGIRGTF